MKKKLTIQETLMITSMLFGLFFGAGNLIFPIYMGYLAGENMWKAITGFLITGVGLPILGVAALGVTRANGLLELAEKVGKKYGRFFTCLLYLTIGPFFAIPRCGTVPYEVGAAPILGENASPWSLFIFTAIFFAVVLGFSLRPNGILTWVGKILNPIFLAVLGVLVITALVLPMGRVSDAIPMETYANGTFFTGFLEGYNTMDALAALAFGIIVVKVIRSMGIEEPEAVAKNTVYAGVFSGILMAVIYICVTVIGAQSRGVFNGSQIFSNGGEVFSAVANLYFGKIGAVILAAIITLACLKTAVGLITSCAETFEEVFKRGPSYNFWAISFSMFSLAVANLGLTAIIEYAVPVLMFLYPLAITLIIMAMFGKFFAHSKSVYRWTTVFTLIAAFFDFLGALPANIREALNLDVIINAVKVVMPFYDIGLGWICPAFLGFLIGFILYKINTAH